MSKLLDQIDDYGLNKDPFRTFENWYEKAKDQEQNVDAMALATASRIGIPTVRFVLHKGVIDQNFLFFSHYNGPKGKNLEENPRAEIVFYWHESKQQVRISGNVIKSSRELSEKYFSSRAVESQVASSISNQSELIGSRQELVSKFEKRVAELDTRSEDCPENWGGYLIQPLEFEFFLYGEHRLNDRFLYKFDDSSDQWDISRLQP